MAEPLQPIYTIRYKTYLKETLVEALSAVFASHIDPILNKTKVSIEFPLTEVAYPAIVIRFYERDIANAGVGHFEWIEQVDSNGYGTGQFLKMKHYLYHGDVEFAVYALSSYDRDLIADSLVQILAMGDLEAYTAQLLDRVYRANPLTDPYSLWHYINLNTDKIQGFGETQNETPWQSEDQMVYNTSYRIGVAGEFYSRIPENVTYGLVQKVEVYPYMPSAGETQPDPKWSGPDGIQGTGDDQPDTGPWQG